MKKISEKYYIQVYGINGLPTFKEVNGTPVQIPGAMKVDLFLHREPYWRISEGITGLSVTPFCHTRKIAIESACLNGKPQAIKRNIKTYLNDSTNIISPRYSRD